MPYNLPFVMQMTNFYLITNNFRQKKETIIKMHKHYKWNITDGDYHKEPSEVSISIPEKLSKRISKSMLRILWRVTLLSLLAFLFLKMV